MKYKTTVAVQANGSLVMTDGILEKNGDMIFGYHALLAICNDQSKKQHSFENGKQFSVQSIGQMHSERLKITISPEFAQEAISVLKKKYPGLEIKGEQPNQEQEKGYNP
ncbi:hypothetical protein [Legionella parisiensis]|uniref:Uncharacterized protein n=1 Tax=Legionella parisiensis TaxID=45071 RepID=A0A1E5JVW9_9GAMM|nr:hypothetical protein [Legionella parisiensis]KTD41278.1 hypothetical protein Lpar_2595 [Legionella parisiensis]OEH48677.1 hypothetical protein lpari_00286 [Legionella parisiensis]STX76421.1 Uncharacterised protein [Legionella parisiensis]